MGDFGQTLLIACLPAVVTGMVACLVAYKNASLQVKIVQEQNKHDIQRLMEQHRIDADAFNKNEDGKKYGFKRISA